MNRIEVNMQTGEIKSIPLTPAEIESALAQTAAEAAKPVVKSDLDLLKERVTALEAKVRP